ncbi:MAG: undecaprenyl-diphosphate phosphatase [Nitrospiria bacterium]
MTELFQAFILGVVEGLTEFIPVSSTGHLIVAGDLLGFEGSKAATFDVFIQLGAILAVVFIYSDRFFKLLSLEKGNGFSGLNGLFLLALTTLPALFFGGLAHAFIKERLFNPVTVAMGLGLGGVVILLVEGKLPRIKRSGLDALEWKDALSIGFFQCLAMWPGVSRAASTIVGGLVIGVERKTAAEYSFLAAVPVMFAATLFDLYKSRAFLQISDIPTFSIGFVVSFASALFAIRYFIHLLGTYTLRPFGWYRIGVAVIIFSVMGP